MKIKAILCRLFRRKPKRKTLEQIIKEVEQEVGIYEGN